MLPTKTEIITGLVLSAIGGLIVALSTDFASFGWYLMLLGVAVYLLTGPQIRHFFPTKARLRQNARKASIEGVSWWLSPLPWMTVVVLLILFFGISN